MFGALALLMVAITVEVGATACLGRTDGFRDPWWTVAVLGGYASSIWLLAVIVRTIPVSVTYALWSGIGTAAIAVVGALFLNENLDVAKGAAILLIVAGVVILNLQGAS